MRFAYADPPYIRQAKRHYGHDARCAEVNHRVLLGYLCENFDGWALSASSSSLREILMLDTCPPDVRIASWVKPFAAFKPNVNPAYTWEPVLFYGGRKRDRKEPTVKDHVIQSITMRKGIAGAKPVKFCYWMFGLLGAQEGDEFTDVFPGTGIVSLAWASFSQPRSEVQTSLAWGCA